MGIHWELEGNKGKMKKILPPHPSSPPAPHPRLKRGENKAL
jgi:hypothetical protein